MNSAMCSREEVKMALDQLFSSPEIEKAEELLFTLLTNEINQNIALSEYSEDTLNFILNYLYTNKKILKDAVYPHLCTKIG